MTVNQGELLSAIQGVSDLRKLNVNQLPQLCEEIRRYIIDVTSVNPGHLGASLGTVELSVALHYVFDTPSDKLIWDVGHQAYTHKILTGRKDQFPTNRTYGGISGFPRMCESEFDAFGVGHSSTSISAALGMAIASQLKGENHRNHIAVIGDGSMTAGMAFEAMNHAGVSQANLLVVLNDNGIAIDKNVGALKEYLTDITTSKFYNRLKVNVWNVLKGTYLRLFINKILSATKSAIVRQSNLFESLKFRYFGPVDGHDVIRMVKIFRDLKDIPGPKILHCITVKGKGFKKAEDEQTRFHAPGVFDRRTGEILDKPCNTKPPKYQVVFGKTLVELAEMNPAVIGVTPAMLTGCSMNMLQSRFPERTFDVGIAEQHAVTFSAGMATQGFIPFCNIYSTFLQRAYDQVIHDVALQGLNVVFSIDRGGIVGEDGATHQGVFDLAYLRCVPNLTVAAPMDESELRNLMFTAQTGCGPFAIRYPRSVVRSAGWKTPFHQLTIGKGRTLLKGQELAILSLGHPGLFAMEAAEKLRQEGKNISVYDMRFLKPLDEELLKDAFDSHDRIITVEDGTRIGGFGSAVAEYAAAWGYKGVIRILGVPDRFIEQGTPAELYAECAFDANAIHDAALHLMIR